MADNKLTLREIVEARKKVEAATIAAYTTSPENSKGILGVTQDIVAALDASVDAVDRVNDATNSAYEIATAASADTRKNTKELEGLNQSVLDSFSLVKDRLDNVEDTLKNSTNSSDDAVKITDKLTAYVSEIDSGIRSIAEQMGAYVGSLKEMRDDMRDRGAAQEKQAEQATKEGFSGTRRGGGGGDFGLIGAFGGGLARGAGNALMRRVVKPAAAAAGRLAGSAFKILKNPKVLLLALAAAVGYSIYKYFTSDTFKNDVSKFFSKALTLGKEWILDPLLNMFGAMKEGLYNLLATVFETFASISIPVPEFLQAIGLPSKLEPYGFLKGAAQSLRTAATESKQARDAGKAAKEAAKAAEQANGAAPSEGAADASPTSSSSGPDASPASPSGTTSDSQTASVASGSPTGGSDGPAIVKVIEVGKGYNIVELADGSVVRREGAWNWRNNNPGNMTYNDYTRSLGALPMPPGADPGAARYAIFPTYEAGRAAKATLLFSGKNYQNLLLSEAIARWAPPNENDTKRYQQTVIAAAGGQDVRMNQLSAAQQQAVLTSMEKVEGYKKGKVTTVKAAAGGSAAAPAAAAPAAPSSPTVANAGAESVARPAPDSGALSKAVPGAGASGGAAATPAAAAPQTGAEVTAASTAVADLKCQPDKDLAVVDASASNQTKASQMMSGGSIPSPIADRGILNKFNYYAPPGTMK